MSSRPQQDQLQGVTATEPVPEISQKVAKIAKPRVPRGELARRNTPAEDELRALRDLL
ncbi:MAG: hypothetical protein ACI9X0_003042 [Kiritimatiellia bacterium]|jgi:hypothetical protein